MPHHACLPPPYTVPTSTIHCSTANGPPPQCTAPTSTLQYYLSYLSTTLYCSFLHHAELPLPPPYCTAPTSTTPHIACTSCTPAPVQPPPSYTLLHPLWTCHISHISVHYIGFTWFCQKTRQTCPINPRERKIALSTSEQFDPSVLGMPLV